ncbi:MAG: S8 family serine peptidase [bacterium]|nr:S8 family serine peptidase [bacterium]
MSIRKCLWAALALCLIVSSCNEEEPEIIEQAPDAESLIPDQYIVVFNDGSITSGRTNEPTFTDRTEKVNYSRIKSDEVKLQMNAFFEDNQISDRQVAKRFTSVFSGFVAKLNKDEVAKLENDPRVDFIEQDRMVTLDFEVEAVYEEEDLSSDVSEGRLEAQTTTCAISNAGGRGSGGNGNTFIWIVDTGIDLDHPDLNVNTNYSRSFADGSADDSNGHGTHVAGIAAAVNNSIGVVGVSPGATLVAVDVLGSGSAPTSTIISGMDYIASNDISGDVVNMSLGPRFRTGCSSASAYRSALDRLNNQSLIALAAGNSADDASFYDPGCQNLSRVYTVASMTCGGGFSSFSNFGSPVDWIATGSSVTSTYRGGRYATLSGTSMASPVVAGILHERGGAPRQCGTVNFGGRSYRVACR